MFDLTNWKNSETLWLNITNGSLGLLTIGLLGWIIGGSIREFVHHYRDAHIKH